MRMFTKILNFFTSLLFAFGFLWFTVAPASFSAHALPVLGSESGVSRLLVLLAILVIVFNIYSIYRYFQIMRHRQRAIEVEGKGGVSLVSIDAIQRRLLDELIRVQDVVHPRVSLNVGGKGKPIRCALTFSLQRSRDITGRADEVKIAVREAFKRMLPNGPAIEIAVSVTDLEPTKDGDRANSETAFSGPVYPSGAPENTED